MVNSALVRWFQMQRGTDQVAVLDYLGLGTGCIVSLFYY